MIRSVGSGRPPSAGRPSRGVSGASRSRPPSRRPASLPSSFFRPEVSVPLVPRSPPAACSAVRLPRVYPRLVPSRHESPLVTLVRRHDEGHRAGRNRYVEGKLVRGTSLARTLRARSRRSPVSEVHSVHTRQRLTAPFGGGARPTSTRPLPRPGSRGASVSRGGDAGEGRTGSPPAASGGRRR
jgi:hypothetical protein